MRLQKEWVLREVVVQSAIKDEIEQVCERYRALYAGAIYDVLEHLGYPNQVLTHELSPLTQEMKLAGPPFSGKSTKRCGRDHTKSYKRLDMIQKNQRACGEGRDCGTPVKSATYG